MALNDVQVDKAQRLQSEIGKLMERVNELEKVFTKEESTHAELLALEAAYNGLDTAYMALGAAFS